MCQNEQITNDNYQIASEGWLKAHAYFLIEEIGTNAF